MHAPTASLGLARAQAGLGRLVAAYETYNRIIREGLPESPPPAFVKAVEDARAEVVALKPRLPTVEITVAGPADPVVTVDGAPVPKAALGVKRFVDPGAHEIAATATGFLPGTKPFSVDEGGHVAVELTLEVDPAQPVGGGAAPVPPPAHPPAMPPRKVTPDVASEDPTQLVLGVVIGGVGVAGLAVAGITGALYLGEKGTAEEHCTADLRCDPEGLDAADSAKTFGLVNTVAFFGGLAAAGVGTVLVLTSPSLSSAGSTAAVAVAFGPDGARLSFKGAF